MDVRSTYKGARISARKVRDVTREIQGLPVSEALDILAFTPRKAARLVAKTVKAAVADAENNFELSVDSLVIKEATAGEGPTMKRFMPRARGSASPIRKRTSRINIILTEDAELVESLAATSERKRKKTATKKSPAKKASKKTSKKAGPKAKQEPMVEAEEAAGIEEVSVGENAAGDEVDPVATEEVLEAVEDAVADSETAEVVEDESDAVKTGDSADEGDVEEEEKK